MTRAVNNVHYSITQEKLSMKQQAPDAKTAEVEVIRLSREAQEQFVSLLLNPPPSDALLRALERHSSLIVRRQRRRKLIH